MTGEATFDFFKDLPKREEDWPDGLREEIAGYTDDFKKHDGLIPQAAAPELLQVSPQRVDQLRKEYGFFRVKYFGKWWYSRRQLEDFWKMERKNGHHSKKGPSLKKAVKAMSADLLKE
jgi:hypothetical protein